MPPPITTTPEVDALVAAGSPVAIGVSGGKDSCALALALTDHLDRLGHAGPRVLVHSDLGRTEWRDSLPTCERLAAATGLELLVVRRQAGDMLDRWQTRWHNNVERYRALSCVQLILPWSTPSMRFCTSELKTDVICRALVRRFPGRRILSASGIRADESANRAKAPVTKPQPKLTSTTHGTTGLDWHPIHRWAAGDVFALMAERGFRPHEAYTRYGSSRVSCAFCIMSNADDLRAAAGCEDNADLYRAMVALEVESTFAFQGGKWLGDVAPHLHPWAASVQSAKFRAERRTAAEARIPKHLLYTAGWPTCVPTDAEAELLAEVRREVADAVGLTGVGFLEGPAVVERYRELMDLKARKN
jgi:3'-phosphoadenosine 5'-phosphosulfate sulfotransferase (PAPS reductase)/FAD synthetase